MRDNHPLNFKIMAKKKIINPAIVSPDNMRINMRFQAGRDICRVERGLASDIRGAVTNFTIKDTSTDAFYNGMETLEEVGPRIRDNFDAIEYEKSYARYRKSVNENKSNPDKDA